LAKKTLDLMKTKILLSIIFVIVASTLIAHLSLAQSPTGNGYDVTVSPVFFDLTADPGTTLTEKIKIRNNTTSPIPIKLQVSKLTGDLNGNLTIKQDKADSSIGWIKFDQESIILRPLEWTEVPFAIDIPKDAAYGYYLTISFTQDNSSPLRRSGATITGAAAVPVLLNVRKPGAKADGKLVEFSTNSFLNEYLPVDFTVKIQNTGNIHIKPHGNIFISGGSRKDLAVLDINPGLGSILPQSARSYEASWMDGFAVMEPVMVSGQPKLDKNGKVEMHLALNWNKLTSLRIGKYDANVLLVFDNGTRDVPLEGKLSFWVFPYKLITGVLILLIAVFFLAKFVLKKYIEGEVKKRSRS
jgi:hypothetical protein